MLESHDSDYVNCNFLLYRRTPHDARYSIRKSANVYVRAFIMKLVSLGAEFISLNSIWSALDRRQHT
jgi:hypothetical protein